MDERTNEMWSTHTMACYSALKGKEILIHVPTWIDLKVIMLNEISKRTNTTWTHLYEVHRTDKFIETERRTQVVGTRGRREGGVVVKIFWEYWWWVHNAAGERCVLCHWIIYMPLVRTIHIMCILPQFLIKKPTGLTPEAWLALGPVDWHRRFVISCCHFKMRSHLKI